jgi:hypothetical protein
MLESNFMERGALLPQMKLLMAWAITTGWHHLSQGPIKAYHAINVAHLYRWENCLPRKPVGENHTMSRAQSS